MEGWLLGVDGGVAGGLAEGKTGGVRVVGTGVVCVASGLRVGLGEDGTRVVE